jgi:hypothetical protein
MHCMTWYISACSITTLCLLYRLNDMVKYVRYIGFGSNGYFVTGATLMGGHYMTYIISGVGHPRLN